MNMKYFRFLYGETAGCFTHFGELNDTLTKEHITFLYLSGIRGIDDEMGSEHSLFLYPEYLDLVVLNEIDENTTEVLKGILSKTKIGTLVVPEGVLEPCLGERMTSVKNIVTVGMKECSSYDITMCGWKFFVKCDGENSLVLLHAMKETGFEDVVMNVKNMHESRACQKNCAPDAFGCAFGCTLHRDYHECKYRKMDASGILCRTGTLLMKRGAEDGLTQAQNGAGLKDILLLKNETEAGLCNALFAESGIKKETIRFFGLSGDAWKEMCRSTSKAEKESISDMEYFIGTDSEVEDTAIAEVCRSGMNRIPVILKGGHGICCSGFFKYKEIN